MIYPPIIIILAVVTALLTRDAPRRATVIAITALVLAVVFVAIAELTGNFLLFYLGAVGVWFGALLLVVRLFLVRRRAVTERGVRRS